MPQSGQDKVNSLTPRQHPRGAACDSIVYPVFSRRAKGLSLGINLFPDRKVCNYDCPYCEVAPFYNPEALLGDGEIERELRRFFVERWSLYKKEYTLKDVSVSGNGEPTLSLRLEEALHAAQQVLAEESALDGALATVPIVLITNSTGFLRPEVARVLADFSKEARFRIWAKFDGGNEMLYRILSRSAFSFAEILRGIKTFSCRVPLTLQTMILSDGRSGDILFDAEAYAQALGEIIGGGGRIEAIQLYTVARRPAEAWVASLSDETMKESARHLSAALACLGSAAHTIRIECYGAYSELDWH